MPFQLIREDILKIRVNAIVNPTDEFYSHSGSTDKRIHKAAGKQLYEECIRHGELVTGTSIITPAYDLKNARYIIHTHGPVYSGKDEMEEKLLYNCYKTALDLSKEYKLKSIAFPLVSSGTFGFPKGEALKIATRAITDYLMNFDIDVYLLVYDDNAFDTSRKIFKQVEDYLNKDNEVIEEEITDEPFHEYLQRIIRKKNIKDSDIYKAVNMDRKLWNNIINGKRKGFRKETAVAIAIGLKLDIKETKELCERAGYSFTDYSLFDRIIKACIKDNQYNVYDINEVLLLYNQPTLGSKARS